MTKRSIKTYIPIIIACIIIGAGSFYGGMRYERNGSAAGPNANFSPQERQARMANGGFTGTTQRTNGTRTTGGGLLMGEIISKESTSITVKLQDGGSKIVFLSNATKIAKSIDGSTADLTVGAQVTTMGTANADGSITAQSVQLRTDMPKEQN